MKLTEDEYDDFLDEVDPDDIKMLWDLTNDNNVLHELFELHAEAKEVLDYFGRHPLDERIATRLARFVNRMQDFQDSYESRLETNSKMIKRLDIFMKAVPQGLKEMAAEISE